jgi:hypothetical protein
LSGVAARHHTGGLFVSMKGSFLANYQPAIIADLNKIEILCFCTLESLLRFWTNLRKKRKMQFLINIKFDHELTRTLSAFPLFST